MASSKKLGIVFRWVLIGTSNLVVSSDKGFVRKPVQGPFFWTRFDIAAASTKPIVVTKRVDPVEKIDLKKKRNLTSPLWSDDQSLLNDEWSNNPKLLCNQLRKSNAINRKKFTLSAVPKEIVFNEETVSNFDKNLSKARLHRDLCKIFVYMQSNALINMDFDLNFTFENNIQEREQLFKSEQKLINAGITRIDTTFTDAMCVTLILNQKKTQWECKVS